MFSRTVLGKTAGIIGAAAALTITASGLAAASTTITPASTPVTASTTGLSFVTPGGLELYCSTLNGSGNTPTAPDNVNTGTDGINIPITGVALSGCDLEGVPAAITVSGSWSLNASGDSGTGKASVIIPAGAGAHIVAGSCIIDAGASTVGPVPFNNATSTATATNAGTLNFVSNGSGALCPAAGAGTATMSGAIKLTPTPSSPAIQVTP